MGIRTFLRNWTLTCAVFFGAIILSPFLFSDTIAYLGALAISLVIAIPIDYSGRGER